MGVVVVTGGGGLLGRAVADALSRSGDDVHALTRADLDVTDAAAVTEAIGTVRPALVVHCAALTNVDECEEHPDRAFDVNARGSANVAAAAERVGAEVVAVSTDYVFDGEKGSAYTEADAPNPIQTYGATKLAGEGLVRESCPRHYVLRPAWIYGPGGRNYLSRVPDLVASGAGVRAVTDQRGSPTYAPDLAEAIAALIVTHAYGTYHVTNAGSCTFAGFCRHVLAVLGVDTGIEEVRRADLGRPAPRPADTSLVSETWAPLGLPPLRPWTDAAAAFARAAGPRTGAPTDHLR